MPPSETTEYIMHRITVAGGNEPVFTAEALQEIYNLTGGNPRLINLLCDQALVSGYSLSKKIIDSRIVKESEKAALIPLGTVKRSMPTAAGSGAKAKTEVLAAAGGQLLHTPLTGSSAFAVLCVAIVIFWGLLLFLGGDPFRRP